MTLVWTPQQAVDVALVVSALGLILCLVLVFVPLRRTRRRRMAADGTIDDGDESDVGASVADRGRNRTRAGGCMGRGRRIDRVAYRGSHRCGLRPGGGDSSRPP